MYAIRSYYALAGVRAQAEFALASAQDPEDRRKLRDMIRAVDEAARATGQILDHAMVAYSYNFV